MVNETVGPDFEWNSTERRKGVDRWPEAEATVTNIEQQYDPKFSFLSVITFTFKDQAGEYFEGKFEMKTADFPDDFMTGSTITIRYNPRNPDKNWCADDYYRAGFGRFQTFDYPIAFLVLFVLFVVGIAVIEIFHVRVH